MKLCRALHRPHMRLFLNHHPVANTKGAGRGACVWVVIQSSNCAFTTIESYMYVRHFSVEPTSYGGSMFCKMSKLQREGGSQSVFTEVIIRDGEQPQGFHPIKR
jgi:hypothetical protein